MNGFSHRMAVAVRGMALMALALMVVWPAHISAQVASFTVTVPKRAAGQFEIAALKISLDLDSSSPIAVSVAEAASGTLATATMTLTDPATTDCFTGAVVCFKDLPNLPGGGAVQNDRLIVIKPRQAGADPGGLDNKLVLILRLRSNENEVPVPPASATCASTMAADETWTISVVGALPRIRAAAVQSLDKKTKGAGNPVCNTSFRAIPLNDLPVAKITGVPQILAGGRVGVDAVMVLDRSGSMFGKVDPSATAPTKMTRLGTAAETFLGMWAAIRLNECQNFGTTCPANGGLPGIQGPVDHLGVVFFDHDTVWLKSIQPTSALFGLKDFSTLNLTTEISAIKAVTPRGSTSIGGGLSMAAHALTPAGSEPNRKVILLMSDGYQNTNPFAQVAGSQVQIQDGGSTTPLPNQPPIQIYGVTVGTGVAVDATINQNVSIASNGFYLNTETDGTLLPNLFVQVLQNAVHYSSVETLRLISDSTLQTGPFQTQVPITSTTQSLAFNLNWDPAVGPMSVRLTPPGGGTPIDFVPTRTATPGLLIGTVAFPRQGVPISAGDWTLRIAGRDSTRRTPFNFSLLADDAAINSSLGPVRAEYAVGGTIRLSAKINDLEKPLTGLSAQAGAQVKVFVVRPGSSLGDVLSDATVTPAPATSADSANLALRKLEALLAANPNALAHANDVVTLVDNGNAANGDATANDGIYSGLVPANLEGHYNFVFLVEGVSEAGGHFIRQQLRTVHVRSLPDSTATTYNSSVSTTGDTKVLNVVATPRNVKGGKMGPGWGNYFWFTAGGGPPVKAVDNLNGTYTASIPFTGSTPPAVSVYFLSQPIVRTASFVPTATDLTPGNRITDHAGGAAGGGMMFPWWVWLILILIILLLIWLYIRSRRP